MVLATLLLVVAASFALLNGANNGSSLVVMASASTSLLPMTAIALLAAGLVVGPLFFGTRVASTLSNKLLETSGSLGEQTFLVGIVAAMAVIGLLSWMKLPSSMTLATIGGLDGAGIAAGLHVSWTISLLAIILALVVPISTGAASFGISRSFLATISGVQKRGVSRRGLKWVRFGTFALQSLAYATNDGQRMFAVLLVALRAGTFGHGLNVVLYLALAIVFAVGAILGAGRLARGTPSQLVAADTFERSLASVVASGAAFASSIVGVPVSMTLTTSSALVGVHGTRGMRRVRWEEVSKLLSAWLITLPVSGMVGAIGALALRWI